MGVGHINKLESLAGIDKVADISKETRSYLNSPTGCSLANQVSDHLYAYNAMDDIVPYFGDYRLARVEAYYQLANSVNLAYHGFYAQAFSTLRSVCELSLLQAALPDGSTISKGEFNVILPLGSCACQRPEKEATTLEEWAIEGCRTPSWRKMLKRLIKTDVASRINRDANLAVRLEEMFNSLHPYVHTRGFLKSATNLSNANFLRFSKEALTLFVDRMMCATQLSIVILLVSFLPSVTFHPQAAAGFIDTRDLITALRVLPTSDAELLRSVYDTCKGAR